MTDASSQASDRGKELRVLILAPIGRDAHLAERALRRWGMATHVCANVAELKQEIGAGAGAVLVAMEALRKQQATDLDDWLGPEPPWSQLPVVALIADSVSPYLELLRRLEKRGNVTFLERPLSQATLVSSLSAALADRRRQYAARALLEELETGTRMRDQFLATLGHELRNPLGAILNAIELLKSAYAGSGGVLESATGVIARQANHLGRILDDLLEVSRIVQGKLELRKQPLDLIVLCRNAAEAAQSEIDKRRHRFTLELPESDVWVDADATRVEQILWNLLVNAAKYTPAGGTLSLSLVVSGPVAEIRMRDNGQGMGPEFLKEGFELFAQAQAGAGGLGLGLPISRRLAEMHGGSLTAASEGHGKGSEFLLRLPRCVSPLAQPHAESRPSSPHRRILVVEDQPDFAWTLTALLQAHNHDARTVATGREAVAIAQEYQPDLVLVDVCLPDLDGPAVAAQLRELLNPGVVLATMSGLGERSLVRRSLEAGCDRHLTKPVSLADLEQLLELAGEGSRPPQQSAVD